jgi:hypothetical protein
MVQRSPAAVLLCVDPWVIKQTYTRVVVGCQLLPPMHAITLAVWPPRCSTVQQILCRTSDAWRTNVPGAPVPS